MESTGTGNLGESQTSPFELSGTHRSHRWATGFDEIDNYASLFRGMDPDKKAALLIHYTGSNVQQWDENHNCSPYFRRECFHVTLTQSMQSEPIDDFVNPNKGIGSVWKISLWGFKESHKDEAIMGAIFIKTCSNDVVLTDGAMDSAEDNSREMLKSKTIFSSEYMGPKGISRPKSKVSRKIKPFNVQESTPKEGKFIICGNVNHGDERAFVKLSVDGRRIRFLLDLGANMNLLPSFLVRKTLDRRNAGSIKVFGGGVVPTKRSVTLPLKYNGSSQARLQFLVTDVEQPILGFKSCINLGFVSIINGSSRFHCKSTTLRKNLSNSLMAEFLTLFEDSEGQTVSHAKAKDSMNMLMCKAIDASSVKEGKLVNAIPKDVCLSLAIEAAISGYWSKVTEIAFLRKCYFLSMMKLDCSVGE
ncbi:unnamed protein product [Lepeophtheirus salmonis]|uniref:(salmon louse) hypothetical protein n=1 Tax=Lepeophtheirus salmonis TaxID=72036 RepID=A0A7R8H2N1_LEPSM|nr:unnamed protein product [Lepeophtheirus salmonis]CAF2826951.1 unnamed protein product [Lepeophtheirus salmonis]